MKTISQLKRFSVKDHSGHGESAGLFPSARITAGVMILVFTLVNGEGAAQQADACRRTSQAVLTSCRAAAQGDYWLALAKCENIADPAARDACRQQAAADLKEALQTCKEQNTARLAACD